MPNSTSTPTSANQSRFLIIEDLLRAKFPMYSLSFGLSVMYDEAKINHKEMHTARETERAQLLALPEQEFQARWARHVAQESAKYVARKESHEAYKAHAAAKQAASENAWDVKVQNAIPQLPSPTDSRPSAGTPEKWTLEKRVEMRAYKEENGTKKTAEHYGMTENRVRQILAKDQEVIGQKSIGNSVFTQRLK